MRTKFSGILTLFLAFVVQITFAQEKTISGNVTDDKGLPLPGVNIVVKNTATGTQSDFDGNFTIKANKGAVLSFSYVGFSTKDIVVGDNDTVSLQLVPDASELEEVVVTALGIERSARSLGYAVSTIKSDDLNEVRETNLLGALQGKTSGVVIQNQSGNVGGSTRILIRGISTLQGNQQPLFVVDGVPISNQNVATGSRITGGFDFGNRAQDINPDDIESISVLKGASAAALYGSRASGGVIVITTKKGKQGQKASISFNTSLRFDNALRLPDFQNQFVSGDDGVYDFAVPNGEQTTAGWGPSINDPSIAGQTFENLRGQQVPFRIFEDGVEDFYNTGSTSINSLTVSGASQNGDDYRLSLAYTDQKGIIPNSALNRTNLGLNAGKAFNDKLSSRFSVNYVRTNTRGTAAAGANDPNVLTNIINGLSRITDFSLFDPEVDEFGNQINDPGGQSNNPLFIARQNATETTVQRFFGNASLQYRPFESFDILGRAGYDTYTDTRLIHNSIGTIGQLRGNYTDDFINNREVTLDLIATYDKALGQNFNLTLRGGTQWNERVFERIGNTGQNLTVPELFDPGNAEVNSPFKDFALRRIFGAFGDLTIDYKNWLILNATGRNDWSSTLPESNNSFFYPSVALSFVFSDALNIQSDFLSYGKLRGSWANVGVDTGAYLLDFTFNPDTGFFQQFGQGGTYPFGGALAFNSDGLLADQDLKPENQENFEIGLEVGLFNNRLLIDATYYENFTEDQILQVPTPQTSGFGNFLTNVGQISNKGVEIQLNAKVIKSEDFSWDVDYNFTTNQFNVDDLGELPGGALNLATGFNGIAIRAVEGEDLQLFGPRWLRATDANGNDIEDQILVDANGIRQVGQSAELGSIFPDYTMGITSTFRYKGWRLSTTFDYREGGKVFSNTVGQLRRTGLAEETAVNNREVFVDPNTFQLDASGAVVPNTTPVSSVQDYWGGFSNASVVEGNVFDATFIKWREISLAYTFSDKILQNTPIKSLQIALEGRNLAIFNTDVPHIDPEAGLGGSASNLQGIERGGVPSTRSFGFNIQANF
ncbi:SusC/RagA family TonB-linked outer membrane protein [Aquimarina sp. MMG016]|uniref:SusC/RagA family TonB-linked outer membrane protein n=1 Tax=Aquimarina sp. MMG016 TaxID=2822690 RepID=UPI001B3A64E9|nr:SusC/RagA family TonB-linked outer membrane protein [Aquimarina sp. MMG016]MBQ4821465.1 SusC/RagA family TonB-linked outer membrane protein [Aquimarina sp. MMG016]